LSALLALLIFAQSATAQAGRLAFDHDGEVFVMGIDGSGREQVTQTAGEAESVDPDWSPDGTQIAFARGDEFRNIRVRGSDGQVRRLTRPGRRAGDGSPDWRPDGRAIVFDRLRFGKDSLTTSIVTVDVGTGGERTLKRIVAGNTLVFIGEPRWSPDGTKILYTGTSPGKDEFVPSLYVLDVATGKSKKLASSAGSGAWSPDGSRIAFSSTRDKNGKTCGSDECSAQGELYVMNADGSAATRLTHGKGHEGGPAWAPDGSAIVFHSSRNSPETEGYELYAIRPDGSCLTWLTNGARDSARPDWQPGSAGLPESFACGAVPRAPTLLPTPKGPGLWLGSVGLRNTLLFDSDDGYLAYGDCALFDPSECGESLDLQTGQSCREHPLAIGPQRNDSFEVRRGALVYRASDTVVWSGSTYTQIYSGSRATTDAVIDALRPIPATDAVTSLEAPRFPASVIRRIERARKLGSIGRIARGMHVSRRQASHLLDVARAVEPFGQLQPADC